MAAKQHVRAPKADTDPPAVAASGRRDAPPSKFPHPKISGCAKEKKEIHPGIDGDDCRTDKLNKAVTIAIHNPAAIAPRTMPEIKQSAGAAALASSG
jgi:hypothetical protein